jgi:hypothetical protein
MERSMRWVRVYFGACGARTNHRASILRQARVSRVARWYTRKWCFSKKIKIGNVHNGG